MLKGSEHSDESRRKIKEARARQKSFLIGRNGVTQEIYDEACRQGLRWCKRCKRFLQPGLFGSTEPCCSECNRLWAQRRRNNLTPEERESEANFFSTWRVGVGADKVRSAWLLKRYGVTPEWYDAKLIEQNGHCALCPAIVDERKLGPSSIISERKYLLVDHDHETGKARGLLCAKCNTALHRVEYIKDWAQEALAYLSRYR